MLRHYENLKFREIAAVLELPEGTIKSRMAEALTQMGRLLQMALADPGASPTSRPQSSPKNQGGGDAAGRVNQDLKMHHEPKESLTL